MFFGGPLWQHTLSPVSKALDLGKRGLSGTCLPRAGRNDPLNYSSFPCPTVVSWVLVRGG